MTTRAKTLVFIEYIIAYIDFVYSLNHYIIFTLTLLHKIP